MLSNADPVCKISNQAQPIYAEIKYLQKYFAGGLKIGFRFTP